MKPLISGLLCSISFWGYSQTWNSLGNCFNPGTVEEFGVYSGKLFISGGAGPGCVGPQGSNVVSFDGTYFDSLSGTVPGGIFDFEMFNNKLICAGAFPYAGQNPWPAISNTHNLAAWDENNWTTGNISAINFGINAIAVYNNELIVGGSFTTINSGGFNRIARWNGSQWLDVGGGFPGNNTVTCMEVFNGELYVGGQVCLPGGPNNYYYNCVKWNGTQWDSVGGKWGPNWVTSMCVDSVNNILYIGGGITYVDTIVTGAVASWNGLSIIPMGNPPGDGALTMAVFNSELYVGSPGFNGVFLSKWDGSLWTQLSASPNGTVFALKKYNGNLYVGGDFDSVGIIPANNIACYGLTCPTNVGIAETASQLRFKIYPNPGRGEINVERLYVNTHNGKFTLNVFDPLGNKVLEKDFREKCTFRSEVLNPGIYLIMVCDSDGKACHSEKLIIE